MTPESSNDLLDKRFKLPGCCPICGKTLIATVTQMVAEGEIWMVDSIQMTCETEPHFASKKAKAWFDEHFRTPYIDWLPLERLVKLAINKKVMAKYGLEYDPELETWFDPKQTSDSPYDPNW